MTFLATANIVTVDSLTQEYLFIPSNVKTAYLTYVMKNFGPPSADAEENKGKTKGKKKVLQTHNFNDFSQYFFLLILILESCYRWWWR